MEEITAGVVGEPAAPPGDAGAEAAAEPTAPAEVVLADDNSNLDAWVAAQSARIEAEVAAGIDQYEPRPEPEPAAVDATPEATAAAETPPAAAEPDYARIAEEMAAKGYKIEAPAPPPDPFAALNDRMVQFSGTDEEYATARTRALAEIPPAPGDTDPEWQDKYDARNAAISERDAAVAEVKRMDLGRQARVVAMEHGWQTAMGRLGQAWSALPETYGLTPERAGRVTNPANATDAVAAVVEQVSSTYEAKLAERETYWKGEVARAKSDRNANAVRAMGSAPQPGGGSGGRVSPAAAVPWATDARGLPTEGAIAEMIAGKYDAVDLSDR